MAKTKKSNAVKVSHVTSKITKIRLGSWKKIFVKWVTFMKFSQKKKSSIAIIGSRGIPNNYGDSNVSQKILAKNLLKRIMRFM
ncbi:MAG: hypothetical protein NKF70_02015 [Methanobacterium sp. ERen5]|nr:MAG: hypothetical protein NKF70_02015 [Methanobacterium sp. ERen5]